MANFGEFNYDRVRQIVESESLVALVPSRTSEGEPILAWLTCKPRWRSAAFRAAYSPLPHLRAAQALQIVRALREHVERDGFKPV